MPQSGLETVGILCGYSRLNEFFERSCDRTPTAVALVCGEESLTYEELDRRANQLAWHLLHSGAAAAGGRIGLLLEPGVSLYVALLAVLKSGAAFVPLDPAHPAERIAFAVNDAELAQILTTSDLAARYPGLRCPVTPLDQLEAQLAKFPDHRPEAEGGELAYIMYTSGTTGRPKGVAITQTNICHFLEACTPLYGVTAEDRVYQGMSVSFDFSIEEIWPTWSVGATLVAAPVDSRRIGAELGDFLEEQRITVLYCVPTLLALLEGELPRLRLLAVGGEACPRDLVDRWARPGRRMLNTYGPTETTVTATWSELRPGQAVTIGRPLPGYFVSLLDEQLRPVAEGEAGEIVIGGAGVAKEYLNRPELTAEKFISDPLSSGGRMYRSGDLGRMTESGEIEYLGRIDSQVKIRGYRIELGEIESLIIEHPAVQFAAAAGVPFAGPAQDIAAYITLRDSASGAEVRAEIIRHLRAKLPAYMVPAYLEILAEVPTTANGKLNRRELPPPRSERISVADHPLVPPATDAERRIVECWRKIFQRDQISVEADFFCDLGGHSLFAAQAVSQLRKIPEWRHVSVGDLYLYRTIRKLARGLEDAAGVESRRRTQAISQPSSARVWMAGAAQFLALWFLRLIPAVPGVVLLAFHLRHPSASWFTLRDAAAVLAVFLIAAFFPVLLKWTVIGRFRPGRHRLWGAYFVRWWLVRKALETSPLAVLAGSPLMPLYLRLLGARVAGSAQIASPLLHLPDLIEIGEDASLGYEAEVHPFVVADGWLYQEKVRIGAGAFIGTKSVLMAGAVVGANARIAEQTLVARSQHIGDGESWHGSPARVREGSDPLLDRMEAEAGQRPVGARLGPALWTAYFLAACVIDLLPVGLALPGLWILLAAMHRWGRGGVCLGALAAGLLFVLSVSAVVATLRLLLLPRVRPGIYPATSWFAWRKWAADRLMDASLLLTNSLYATLYAIPWMRALGGKIGRWSEISTVSHVDPALLELGEGTFVADLASVGAASFHAGSVALGNTRVGQRTFLGNASVVRSGVTLPENCLIGVQSATPLETVNPGTSWLGSPALFLPSREVLAGFDEQVTYRPSARLVAYRLFVEFFRVVVPPALFYLYGTLCAWGLISALQRTSVLVAALLWPLIFFAAGLALTLLVAGLKWIVVGRYRDRIEPLWAPFVRHTELITGIYESFVVPAFLAALTGTPLAPPVLRLFGAHLGRRIYLETTYATEFDLVAVADDAAIGRATSLQTHLFEDRVMKMARLSVGVGVSIGPRSVVLYNSALAPKARLDALSLVIKSEWIPPASDWRGIPARLVS